MKQWIKAGVSTACFYPMETIDSFRLLAENGVQDIEVFFNSPSELKPAYLQKINSIRKQYAVHISSIHPFTSGSEALYFFSDYPNRFEDGLELYSHYFKAAETLGASLFVLHGDLKGGQYPAEKGYEHIKKMTDFACEFGVTIAQENVSRCKSCDPQYLAGLKAYFPKMKFVLDIKQAVRSGEDPLEYVRLLGENIAHIHMSDHKPGEDCLPIGKGEMDLPAFSESVLKSGFSGYFLLELYRDNFGDWFDVLKSYQKLKEILCNINGG